MAYLDRELDDFLFVWEDPGRQRLQKLLEAKSERLKNGNKEQKN